MVNQLMIKASLKGKPYRRYGEECMLTPVNIALKILRLCMRSALHPAGVILCADDRYVWATH